MPQLEPVIAKLAHVEAHGAFHSRLNVSAGDEGDQGTGCSWRGTGLSPPRASLCLQEFDVLSGCLAVALKSRATL